MSEKQCLTSLLCFFLPVPYTRNFSKMLPLMTKPPLYGWRGNAPVSVHPGGLPETPLCCPASLAPWEQPNWAEHRICSRRCWLPARCRTNLQGMFPLAGSLPLAPAPNDINRNCCYLWFFWFIWITVRQLGYPKSLNNSYSGKPDSR